MRIPTRSPLRGTPPSPPYESARHSFFFFCTLLGATAPIPIVRATLLLKCNFFPILPHLLHFGTPAGIYVPPRKRPSIRAILRVSTCKKLKTKNGSWEGRADNGEGCIIIRGCTAILFTFVHVYDLMYFFMYISMVSGFFLFLRVLFAVFTCCHIWNG